MVSGPGVEGSLELVCMVSGPGVEGSLELVCMVSGPSVECLWTWCAGSLGGPVVLGLCGDQVCRVTKPGV